MKCRRLPSPSLSVVTERDASYKQRSQFKVKLKCYEYKHWGGSNL